MRRKHLLALAFIAMLAALPLVGLGVDGGDPALARIGAALLALGGALGLLSRFVGR